MTYIYRTVSAIFVIFIIVPLCFINLLVQGIFTMFNNFTYEKFTNTYIPFYEGEYYGLVKVWMLIAEPIVGVFVNFYYWVKSIRF